MDHATVPMLGFAPDRAIRGRLSAILIDGLLVGLASRLLFPAIGIHSFGGITVAFIVLQFLYFFLQEASGGQTIGKHRANLRVVQLDGTAPTLQQVAIRNALRVFDALPLFYASGLVSVMWSGPALRQRMGDKVAGTAVILAPGGKSRATPDWLLPTLTVLAVLLSVVIYGVLYNEYHVPDVDANAMLPTPVPGFAGDNSQVPAPGSFTATALLGGAPAIERATGRPMVRSWEIAKTCQGATSCRYALTRVVPGLGQEHADLVPQQDGWHVDFPTHAFRTTCPGSSGLTTAMRRASFVLHFDTGGQSVQAHERTHYRATKCGEFTDSLDWSASLAHF
ncbi:MAG: hypothetical protein QOJ29_4366 [Thermoleophilaceae bacterium]|jgi:uncharacterized RDD family membrane protein YckC|nr:hypothetical protein [Thermoleophilaceae bacterium]